MVRNIHAILHRALKDAVRWGYVVRNVADAGEPPRGRSPEMRPAQPSAQWTSALARTVAADLAARGWQLERVMSDNAQEFRSATFQATIASLSARQSFIRAGRPQTNGCVERVQQTILDECWKPAFARYLIPKQTGLRLDLERYLRSYNTERAHPGRWTRGRTPQAVLGKAKLWHNKR
jgi:transposase InsO family protein